VETKSFIHRLYGLSHHLRRRRMARFVAAFSGTVLDVGGTPSTWSGVKLPVTVLNREPPHSWDDNSSVDFVLGDGTRMDYADGAFEVVYCNSVIEHLGSYERQAKLADEIRRVGAGYWVQTPALCFPIEPHYLTPLVHWLPRRARRRVLPYTIWGLVSRPSREYMDAMIDEIRLVTKRELTELFPDATIIPERFAGLVKSWIVVRRSR